VNLWNFYQIELMRQNNGHGNIRPLRITLQRYCTENSKQIFPEIKLRGLFPNSHDRSAYFAAAK
jgi:hypothetical protein